MTRTSLLNKQLYIFDWDGTVMDSVSHIVSSLCYAAEEHHVAIAAEAAKNIIGLGLPEAMQTLFPSHPDKWDSIRQRYAAHYVATSKETKLFDGMRELLTQLHTQDKLLAVATGKSRKGLDRVLDESGLRSLFAATRGADETKSKPDPLMLEEILAQTGIDVANAVMIGDTSYDMEMAQHIHMDRVAVTYGVHDVAVLTAFEPAAVVNDVMELSDCLLSGNRLSGSR